MKVKKVKKAAEFVEADNDSGVETPSIAVKPNPKKKKEKTSAVAVPTKKVKKLVSKKKPAKGDDADDHKASLSKLKEIDPEFYKYLEQNDKKLLKFNADFDEDEDDDDEQNEEENGENSEEDDDDDDGGKANGNLICFLPSEFHFSGILQASLFCR